ncbi:hypothetical protein ABTY61_38020 [Kitasatospora sp. NPDC096128]|uniref:hypothetical protein n=1 Tax=Kitasatospora sp. NPDC096128 TaxID=3155547 RepID=UPI0033328FD4
MAGAGRAPIRTFLDGHASPALVAGRLLSLALAVLPLCPAAILLGVPFAIAVRQPCHSHRPRPGGAPAATGAS